MLLLAGIVLGIGFFILATPFLRKIKDGNPVFLSLGFFLIGVGCCLAYLFTH